MKKFLLSLMAILAFVGVRAQVELKWTASTDWAGSQAEGYVELTQDDYTVRAEGGTATLPTINASKVDMRAYAGATVTITAGNGKEFTKVVFNISDAGQQRLASLTADKGEITYDGIEAPYATVTWQGEATNNLVITVGANSDYGTTTGKAGQFDIASPIVITEAFTPVDFTDKVDVNGWQTGIAATSVGNYTKDVAQKEHYLTNTTTNGEILYQTVSELENGTYTVELYANASYTQGRGFASSAANGELGRAVVYAGDVQKTIPVIHQTAVGTNNIVVLENVQVTDGTLRMGLRKIYEGSNWHTIQIKSLTQTSDANNDLAAAEQLAYWQEIAADELNVNVGGAEKAALNAATTAADIIAALPNVMAARAAYNKLAAYIETAEDATEAIAFRDNASTTASDVALFINTEAVKGASVTNPIVTDFVVNGTFTNDVSGWICTGGFQNQTKASNQNGAFTVPFFENWNPSAKANKMYQVIEGIPNGTYKLNIAAFVNTYAGDAQESQFVFANDEKVYLTTGIPTAYEVWVIVDNNTVEIGLEQTDATANWMGIDNVSLTFFGEGVDIAEAKASAVLIDFEAVNGQPMETEIAANLATAKETFDADKSDANLSALTEAVAAAKASAKTYADAKVCIDNANTLLESTNFYTTEAYESFKGVYDGALEKYNDGSLTPAEATALENPIQLTAWQHDNWRITDDLLLSTWTINDVQAQDYSTALYINTWSTEGETDGSNFKVPFFENWTGDGNSLAAAKLTATMTNLPEGRYDVEALIRVRGKNGYIAPAYGITADVNEGEAVDVATGENIAGSNFHLAKFTATGIVGADGVLKFNINIAEDNNISWLSFKDVKYTQTADATQLAYETATETIEDGQTYRVFTEVGENKFYLKADGYLTANIDDAKVFNFAAVNVAGTLYPTGWDLGCKFTNPGLTGGSTGDVVQQGHIIVGGNNRNDWERQVFFLNGEGKYAVRATNANSANWGAATFWTVTNTDAELPNADYQLEASYVWQLEAVVDEAPLTSIISKLEATIAATDTYTDESNAAAAATAVLDEVKGATYASNKAVREAVANVQAAAQTFIAAIAPVQDIDITEFYITNATPTANADGWTIVLGTAVNQWAGNTYDAANNNAEFWNYGGSTIKQAVTLPAGDFKLNAVAMTRTGMVGTLFAGENTMEIATIGSDVVNSRTQANTWFNDGNGVNELPFTMDAAGEIEIGITTDNATPDHWTVWRSFQLILAAPVTELAQEINIERYTGKGYDATTFEPDFTEGLAFLGIENVTDATLTFINPDDTEVVPTFGEGTPDGWCDETGALVGWGDNSKICVKFNNADADYMVCDMNGADVAGTTYTVKYALSANGKKVIYTINVTFVEKVVTIPTEISDLIVETGVEYTDEENADGNWNEKTAVLTDEQVQSILTELGITSLDEADVLGYNPTTSEFIINFEGYDGWRNAEGDFESYGDNAPFCVKYTDGVTYLCYDKPATSGYNEFAAYWAISNGTKAVLVKITFTTCTAINGVEADTNKAEVIYDLAGRRINNAQKGIYIINGKKVAVK